MLDMFCLKLKQINMSFKSLKSWLKPVSFILIILILLYLVSFSPLREKLQDPARIVIEIEKYKQTIGLWIYPLFILVFIVTACLMIPASFMVTLGSIIFGSFLGSVINIISTVSGACVAFIIGRYFLGDLAYKFKSQKLEKWQGKIEKEGFKIVLYLRLIFFPYFILNFGASATRIRFFDFFLGTLLGQIPNIVIVTFFITAIKEIIVSWKGFGMLLRFDIILPIILFISGFFVPRLLKRFFEKENTPVQTDRG